MLKNRLLIDHDVNGGAFTDSGGISPAGKGMSFAGRGSADYRGLPIRGGKCQSHRGG